MHTLSNEDVQLIALLEARTGARAVDVVETQNGYVFLVQKGELGKAIGRQGANLERLRKETGKNVEFVEYSKDLTELAENLFKPVELKGAEIRENNGLKTMFVKVDADKKGLAIGRGGSKINRARLLLKKYFGVNEVKVS